MHYKWKALRLTKIPKKLCGSNRIHHRKIKKNMRMFICQKLKDERTIIKEDKVTGTKVYEGYGMLKWNRIIIRKEQRWHITHEWLISLMAKSRKSFLWPSTYDWWSLDFGLQICNVWRSLVPDTRTQKDLRHVNEFDYL